MISIYNSVESPIKDIEILGNTVDGVSVGILQDDGQYKITLFTNNGLDNMSPDYREDKEELLLPCQLEKIGDSTDRLYYDKEEKAWCIYKVGQSKIVLPVTFTIFLNSFYGTTNLYMVSGEVEGTIKAKVSKSLGASVSSLNDKADVLIDKIDAMLGGRVDLDGYATIEYVDVKDGEIKGVLDNMFEEYTEEQISVDFPNASTISIVDNDDLFTSTTIEGALRELASNSSSGIGEAIEQNKNDISDIKNELSKTENTSYTTANGVKEFECKDGYVDNVVIEGKTLVNLVDFDVSRANSDGITIRTYFKSANRVSNGTYTLFNNNDKEMFFVTSKISTGEYVGGYTVLPNTPYLLELDSDRQCYGIDFGITSVGWVDDASWYTNSNVKAIILEGDHTDKPISYFEGLKSVGQGDKIEVLSYNKTDKNLIEDTFTYTKDMLINYSDGEFRSAIGHYACDNYIEIEPSTDYMFIGINANRAYYDENKQVVLPINNSYLQVLLDKTNGSKKNFAIEKTPSTAKYVRVTIHKDNLVNGKAYLYKNSNYDHKQILTTLRSLPNGVKDTIEKRGNKYYKIKRCEEIVLNGSENWLDSGSVVENNRHFALDNILTNTIEAKNSIYCDKFETVTVFTKTKECIHMYTNSFNLSINTSKANSVSELKTWLKSNPVTVVYELATPIITELPNFNPQTFSDKTTLLLNSGVVQGEASFEVTNSLGSELEVLKGKSTDIEEGIINNLYGYQKHKLSSDVGKAHKYAKAHTPTLNLDDFTKCGFYRLDEAKNSPDSYIHLIVNGEYPYVLQIASSVFTNVMWFRVRYGSETWTSWQKVATTSTLSLLEQQVSELEIQAMERGI